jgi:hypothetical protein
MSGLFEGIGGSVLSSISSAHRLCAASPARPRLRPTRSLITTGSCNDPDPAFPPDPGGVLTIDSEQIEALTARRLTASHRGRDAPVRRRQPSRRQRFDLLGVDRQHATRIRRKRSGG